MIRVFSDPDELAEALADTIAAAIRRRLAKDGSAAIAVSGGTTPVRFFQALSTKSLNWRAVTITLVDERWVPADSPRSNARLVQKNLLQGPAAAASFVPLADAAVTPEDGKAGIERAINALNLPFAAVTLGMGNDGHTASFFPGGDRLGEALNPSGGQIVETMHAPGAAEPRVTLTLPLLLAADRVAIQIEGAAKRAALDAAMQPGPVLDMPIRAVLAARPAPDIYWCP
jgi:6-phosphogluconolactonase